MKVCVIGAHKTGTSSLTDVLQTILKSKWDPSPMRKFTFDAEGGVKWAKRTNQTIIRDTPFNHFDAYKILDKTFPEAKFILTVREGEDWYGSVERWLKIPANYEWRLSIYDKLYGWSSASRENVIGLYNQRNRDIINYFSKRPGKLLIVNLWKDRSTKELKTFLGLSRKIPTHYPHLLKTSDVAKHAKRK